MTMKKVSLLSFVILLSVVFLGGCKGITNGSFTKPEYIKEVIVHKEKFNDIMDKFLDQVDTYDGTEEAKNKLSSELAEATEYVNNIKADLGSKIPEDCREHYNNMIAAYNLYLEGMNIYVQNLPKALGDERNNAIKQAEDKLHEAQNAMMNL